MKAIWNGVTVAESKDTVVVEGNHYFPSVTLDRRHVVPSDHQSVCPWKGTASYYSLVVDGKVNQDAVWFYPDPLPAAASITNRVAFWKGVRIVD